MFYFRVTQLSAVSLRSVIQCLSYIFISRALFQSFIRILVMVRTRGGSPFGRGLDSVHPSERPQLRSRPQYHLRSLRQYLRSLRGFDDIRHGWDPRPRHLYHSVELGGPGPPSRPAHQARVSHPHPGLRHLQSHQL